MKVLSPWTGASMCFKKLEEYMDSISLAGHRIEFEDHSKLLGVHFDPKLNFNFHINELCIKAGRQLNAPYLVFQVKLI